MNSAKHAVIEFPLYWNSESGSHRGRFYANKIDFWRDILPGSIEQQIKSLNPGETCEAAYLVSLDCYRVTSCNYVPQSQ